MKPYKKVLLLSIMAFMVSACSSKPRVDFSYDGSMGLDEYQTYNFSSSTELKQPEVEGELQLYFSAAVEQQLQEMGLVRSDTPEILINVSVDLEDKNAAPANPGKCPRYADNDSLYIEPLDEAKSSPATCVFKEGLVTVDLIEADSDSSILNAVSHVRLDKHDRGVKLIPHIQDDVNIMFNGYMCSVPRVLEL